jgi:hypothetical protein
MLFNGLQGVLQTPMHGSIKQRPDLTLKILLVSRNEHGDLICVLHTKDLLPEAGNLVEAVARRYAEQNKDNKNGV